MSRERPAAAATAQRKATCGLFFVSVWKPRGRSVVGRLWVARQHSRLAVDKGWVSHQPLTTTNERPCVFFCLLLTTGAGAKHDSTVRCELTGTFFTVDNKRRKASVWQNFICFLHHAFIPAFTPSSPPPPHIPFEKRASLHLRVRCGRRRTPCVAPKNPRVRTKMLQRS